MENRDKTSPSGGLPENVEIFPVGDGIALDVLPVRSAFDSESLTEFERGERRPRPRRIPAYVELRRVVAGSSHLDPAAGRENGALFMYANLMGRE